MILATSCTTPTTGLPGVASDLCSGFLQPLDYNLDPAAKETEANTQDTPQTVRGIRRDNARKRTYCGKG